MNLELVFSYIVKLIGFNSLFDAKQKRRMDRNLRNFDRNKNNHLFSAKSFLYMGTYVVLMMLLKVKQSDVIFSA